jgi:hypothetical protein
MSSSLRLIVGELASSRSHNQNVAGEAKCQSGRALMANFTRVKA